MGRRQKLHGRDSVPRDSCMKRAMIDVKKKGIPADVDTIGKAYELIGKEFGKASKSCK